MTTSRQVGQLSPQVQGQPTLWLAVLALLIATTLAAPRLNYDAFSEDELNSIIAAGGAHYDGAAFPIGVVRRLAERSPDQALGFPLVARVWGDYIGWQEFTLRILPLLAGLLTIAATYRTGKDLFQSSVGVIAALSLATSTYYLTYMHKFRTFTLASLCIVVVLWCYWYVALSNHRPRRLIYVALFLAGVGITYLHYFIVPFLGSLALFHLLFVEKNRRWWLTTLTLLLIFLAFLPQLGFLLNGVIYNAVENPDLRDRALSPGGIVERTAFFFGNGQYMSFIVVATVSVLALIGSTTRKFRRNIGLILFTVLMTLLGVITMNEIAGVMVPHRVRYLMGVWVPLSLLVGVSVWMLRRVNRPVAYIALGSHLLVGLWTSVDGSLMVFDGGDDDDPGAWREVTQPIFEHGEPQDAFVYMGDFETSLGHYTHNMTHRNFIHVYHGEQEMQQALDRRTRVWFAWNRTYEQPANLTAFFKLLNRRDYVRCETYWADDEFELRLYAASPIMCPGGDVLVQFGEQIALVGLDQSKQNSTLTVDTNWQIASDLPLYTYAIGFYVFDNAGALIKQEDISLEAADGPYLPLRVMFDLNRFIISGRYDVRFAVYDWQTGERLMGQDRRTYPPQSNSLISIENPIQ